MVGVACGEIIASSCSTGTNTVLSALRDTVDGVVGAAEPSDIAAADVAYDDVLADANDAAGNATGIASFVRDTVSPTRHN